MALRNRTELATDISNNLPDNTTGDISPSDVRNTLTNIIDSALLTQDSASIFNSISASLNNNGFVTTSSFNSFTSSYRSGSFTGSFTGSLQGTASYALNGGIATRIATGSTTASVDIGSNLFTIITGSMNLFIINSNKGITFGTEATASGLYSRAYGYGYFDGSTWARTVAIGINSHAEGEKTTAIGQSSHAEGFSTLASGSYSHAEGAVNIAFGNWSHVEGASTITSGAYSHAEGQFSKTIGLYSHAEGGNTTISYGNYSHAEGNGTIASGSYQHAEGHYNTHNNTSSLVIIGNGTFNNRSDLALFNSESIVFNKPVTGSFVGDLEGTASYATTALNAISASYTIVNVSTGSASYLIVENVTASYVLSAQDSGKYLLFTSSSIISCSIPAGLISGFNVTISQEGSGQVVFIPGVNNLYNRQNHTKTAGQYASVNLVCKATNEFNLLGDTDL